MRQSAGVLLWRRRSGVLEVLLAHPGGPLFTRRDDHHWSIPKGEYEPGETALEAAYREFAEETGHPVPGGEPLELGASQQRGGKVNTVYGVEGDLDPGTCVSNEFTMTWPPGSGRERAFPEMDRYGWFDLAAARVKLFDSQLVFLDRLAAALTE